MDSGEETDMDYEKDMQIDETALDVEWLEQPSLMMRYCRFATEARASVDMAKERLDAIKAQLDTNIRKDPAQYGLEKLTETLISNTVILQPDCIHQQEVLNELKMEDAMAQCAVRALEHRKKALENLVVLHGQQYFAGPSVPRDLTKKYSERKEWERKQKDKMAAKNTLTEGKRERKRV